MTEPISIGFLPLTDCAVLVAAHERGFAAAEGLALTLVRDTSWATARDRLVFRQVQAAHMLAPLAVAVSLGLGAHAASLAAPFKLNVNGSQIVLASGLAEALGLPAAACLADPAAAVQALAAVVKRLGRVPVFGIVHRFSSHALLLRYWLGHAGIDPDRDVALRVLPPSFMGEALAAGEIDLFCAGEPWGSAAVASGAGVPIAAGARIWRGGVEKVLAMRTDWMQNHPDVVDRLLRSLDAAADWCDDPANHADLAVLLSQPGYVDQPPAPIRLALSGQVRLGAGAGAITIDDFMVFHRGAAGFPWRSQALWIYAQFCRWGFLTPTPEAERAAACVFRSDITRRALAGGATPLPGASAKLEGTLQQRTPVGSRRGRLMLEPDTFFDGTVFDPHQIAAYLAKFSK